MGKFLLKILLYSILIVALLEIAVRVFHLHRDTPARFIDEFGVEKWVPDQHGYSVTGIRKQNYSEYRINKSGYNSRREFNPGQESFEVALVGDSYIEGFHQPYSRSIGVMMEEMKPGIEVYEYGYAGYDMADQLHLITAYKEQFRLIDRVVIYLKFPDDLLRDRYVISQERIRLEGGIYQYLKKSKLLVYIQNIGLLGVISSNINQVKNFLIKPSESSKTESIGTTDNLQERYLNNFIKLSESLQYNKRKFILLLDGRECPKDFISYLNEEGYAYIDYGQLLASSKSEVTLVYDQHWNDWGRRLIATGIIEELFLSE